MYDSSNPAAPHKEIYQRFRHLIIAGEEEVEEEAKHMPTVTDLDDGEGDDDGDEEGSDDADGPDESAESAAAANKPEAVERRKKRIRRRLLRRKSLAARTYQFSHAGNGVQGVVFVEIVKVTDLPPERNVTRTSFDMDPFVVISLGRKTLRTPVVRHNLNPVYNEKMVFQVMKHEQFFTIGFTIMDRDKFSNNDFVASGSLPLQVLIQSAQEADPETGLYSFPEHSSSTDHLPSSNNKPQTPRLTMSRTPSSNSISKISRPSVRSKRSSASISSNLSQLQEPSASKEALSTASDIGSSTTAVNSTSEGESESLRAYTIPLALKNKDRWEDKHAPELHVQAKYVPYSALRQHFWRLMLKQYDADDSGRIDKVEMTTMLDTLGSTLKGSTIDGFFRRFSAENEGEPQDNTLSFDQAVICLEDTLQALQKKQETMPVSTPDEAVDDVELPEAAEEGQERQQQQRTDNIGVGDEGGSAAEELQPDDLGDDKDEEHVIMIRECPLCHQPRLGKRSDADIITHIATCASQDWRQVDSLVMGGFVTASQAQRKWYTKVITKISYGGYRLGANSANILVQDRVTGQITEERMSVYVRLGIRLLYKGLKSRDMEKKRSMHSCVSLFSEEDNTNAYMYSTVRKILKSMSIKQGRRYDDPASASQIQDFINFHNLDMSEVFLPVEEFKTFNQFFYRALKPGARPCCAPDNPKIVVSPADCRSVVFNFIDDATRVWVKGREFSVERLLGDAYPEHAHRYRNGAVGVFRLAPQDYHRFHIPVDGVAGTPKTIEGEYYTVNPMAIRSALDVYGENVRVLVPIDSVAHGLVMVVCVGAMMVGSTVITREAGEKVHRAEELGYFKFGGSTLLLLFQEGMVNFDHDLVANSNGPLETLVCIPLFFFFFFCQISYYYMLTKLQIRVGMSVGHSPDVPQYEPILDKRRPEPTSSTDEK